MNITIGSVLNNLIERWLRLYEKELHLNETKGRCNHYWRDEQAKISSSSSTGGILYDYTIAQRCERCNKYRRIT
jgi:hypothetical protein